MFESSLVLLVCILVCMDLSQPGFTFLIIPLQSYGREQVILGSLAASYANLEEGKSN